jgi:glutamate-ammonia-ligase adenylyltransferase
MAENEQIGFRDASTAAKVLRLMEQALPAEVYSTLAALLRESPDPDQSLALFQRLVTETEPGVIDLLRENLALVHYAVTLFGYSHYLGETVVQNPDVLRALAKDRNLERSNSTEDYREAFARLRTVSGDNDLSALLACFKKREYVRIVLRDVLGIAGLAEVTAEISALADVLIEEALTDTMAKMALRYGAPQTQDAEGRTVAVPICVLSMGKLGGRELNYNSDVDLLFLYGDGEREETTGTTNREFFVRLSQAVTEVLSRVTKEGTVFRIDLRLRPQGHEGEPAASFSSATRYYANVAHDWELQALIKARHSAGDIALARKFVQAVQPKVYTPELNFAAIETALRSLKKISSRRRLEAAVHQHARTVNVKIDHGGIRDIEFLVQCLQRVYGGKETWLRSGGTLFSLQKLHDKGHLSGHDYHELTVAYTFLRRVEHRLQLQHGQQTYQLPADDGALQVLCASLRERGSDPLTLVRLHGQLAELMAGVALIYDRTIHSEQHHREHGVAQFTLTQAAPAGDELTFAQIMDRLEVDAPKLHRNVTRARMSVFGRKNLHRFLAAAITTPERLHVLRDHAGAVERAMHVFENSGHLSDVLARNPEVVTAFEESGTSTDPGLFEAETRGRFSAVLTASNYRDRMELLRQRFRDAMFLSAARDLVHPRRVYESLEEFSTFAGSAIDTACSVAGDCQGFAIMALGRLGTREYDWDSDADLLFVRDESLPTGEANEIAGRVVELLAAYTKYGNLFAVDARLRPHGGEGEFVITPEALGAYFATDAMAWEALTYTKLRYIGGDTALAKRACDATIESMKRFARDPDFFASISGMREKLERAQRIKGEFKLSDGGFYDVDFLLSALQVRHGVPAANLNTEGQIRQVKELGYLQTEDAALLSRAAELYRSADHSIRLVTGRRRKTLPENESAQSAVNELCQLMMKRKFDISISEEIADLRKQVRVLYARLMAQFTREV